MKQQLKRVKIQPTAKDIKKAQLQTLQVLFDIELLNHDIDELQQTVVFQNDVKQYANLLRKSLEKHLNGGFYKAYQQDEQMCMNVSNNFHDLATQISGMSIQERMYLSQRIPSIMQEEKKVEILPLHA